MSAARLALLLTAAGSLLLIALSFLAGAGWVDIISWAFVLLPIAAWVAAGVLLAAHRQRPEARNLGERAIVALRDALVATIGAVLGLNRTLTLGWPNEVATGLLALGLMLVTAYSIAWLVQFYLGRWD